MAKLITPEIFQKNTAEDYLKAAIDTAEWIDTLAIKTEYGRIWQALPEGQDGYREDVPLFTPKSMYDGSAGIGIFFIRLYEATGDTRWLTEAEEAAAHIIATKVGVEWYQTTLHSEVKGIIPVPGWAAGPYNGPVGEAYFLEDLYQVTGKQEYRDYVLYVADVLLEAAVTDERGLHWSDQEDITADGGFVVFLDILYRKTGIKKYLELAKEGLTYAMNIAVGDETGRLIPYQDHPVTGPTYDKYYLSTCHGPVGSTLAFRELYEITGEEIYRNWTIELSRGIVRAGAPEKHSWGFWNCQCQCCGTAGILEHFAAMYEYTGKKEFYDYMIRTADVMLSDSDHRTPGLRTWYDSWWRTIPTRVVSYPGLYVGVAGCASSLLRTYAALTGKKLTNLYEYHFFEKF
uniref:lanthionine synthetase LanC family protein n=1 Tax=Coprococcus sp. TaxID=2049024 RepID=UPI0040270C53